MVTIQTHNTTTRNYICKKMLSKKNHWKKVTFFTQRLDAIVRAINANTQYHQREWHTKELTPEKKRKKNVQFVIERLDLHQRLDYCWTVWNGSIPTWCCSRPPGTSIRSHWRSWDGIRSFSWCSRGQCRPNMTWWRWADRQS